MGNTTYYIQMTLVILAFFSVILAVCCLALPSKINYLPADYASETSEIFYQEMINLERNTTLKFNEFPKLLTPLQTHIKPGDEILTTKTDTLYLLDRGIDYGDINRYPYYVIKDNNENFWTLFRHGDKYFLTREDEEVYKAALAEIEKDMP